MVKSVVKAMDTITAFRNGKVKQFVVAGASKRGWTTWLTAPVDKRVVAIAPIVMDLLDFEAGLLHMFRSYGGWTFAFEPYWKQNITQSIIDNPIGLAALGKVLDPLNYKENLFYVKYCHITESIFKIESFKRSQNDYFPKDNTISRQYTSTI